MSAWTDFLDWMGGYPYEASKAGDVVMHMRTRGLRLREAVDGHGLSWL